MKTYSHAKIREARSNMYYRGIGYASRHSRNSYRFDTSERPRNHRLGFIQYMSDSRFGLRG